MGPVCVFAPQGTVEQSPGEPVLEDQLLRLTVPQRSSFFSPLGRGQQSRRVPRGQRRSRGLWTSKLTVRSGPGP